MNSSSSATKETTSKMSEQEKDAANSEEEVKTPEPTVIKTKMALLCMVAIQLLLIVIIIFLLFITSKKCSSDSKTNTCQSPECLHEAAHLLNSIDFNQEPCENFHDYACGGSAIVEDVEPLDIFAPEYLLGDDKPQFVKKFQMFYESCVIHEDKLDYEARIGNAKELLGSVGSFRAVKEKEVPFNLTEFVADMILHDSMPLFDVGVDVDTDGATYVIKLMLPDQSSVKLGHWSSLSETKRKCLRVAEDDSYETEVNTTRLYNSFVLCQKDYGGYLDSVTASMLEMDFLANITEKDAIQELRDTRVFIEFAILSKFDVIPSPPDLEEINLKREFVEIKVGDLQNKFPIIQWETLFEILSNKSISNETIVQLYNEDYFEDVFKGFSEKNFRLLNNAFLSLLGNSLFESTVLPTHRHSREQYCKDQSKELMPDIANYIHKVIVEPEVVQKKNKHIREKFDILKKKLVDSLVQKWIDEKTNTSIIAKLNNLNLVLFENKDVETERVHLETVYDSLDILEDEYQQNFFNLMEFRRRQFFALQGENVTSQNMYRTFLDVTQKELFLLYPSNIVCVPLGLYSYVRDDLPQYLTDSRLGFALAKVIGYAFDSIGIDYGLDNMTETARNFYQNFANETNDELPLLNPLNSGDKTFLFSLNNDLSESERIADNTAMRLLTDTFSSFRDQEMLPLLPQNFTKEKVFFIHLVQGLCRKMKVTDFMVEAHEKALLPPQLRVANFLGNSKEFLNIFGCKSGSGMARLGKSLQFPHLE